MQELTFTVPGMTCGHCTAAVEKEVGGVPGVAEVHADLDSKEVVVRGDGWSWDDVAAAVDEAGYEAVR